MPVTLSDLVNAPSVDTARALIYQWLATQSFPTTSWGLVSVPRRFVESFSRAYQDAMGVVANIANGGYLDSATGDWLTLYTASFYRVTRNPAVFARGTAILSDGGAGPFVVNAGDLWATSLSGKRFQNVTGGVLAQNGTLSLTWQAESPGATWNIPVNTLTQLTTTLPGVTINNPGTSNVWLSQTGNDAEADEALRIRCRARWPGLGGGATALVYEGWVRTASAEVALVKVLESYPLDGQVTVVVSGKGAPVSGGGITAINAALAVLKPLCVRATAQNATSLSTTVTATLYVKAAFFANAQTQAYANLTAYQLSLAIGQPVYTAAIIEQLMLVPGAVNVVLASPSADVIPAVTAVVTLAPTVTVISV